MGQFEIFSKRQLSLELTSCCVPADPAYFFKEPKASEQKLSNTILVVADTQDPLDQYPFIQMLHMAATNKKQRLEEFTDYHLYDLLAEPYEFPNNNAFYILGILEECQKLKLASPQNIPSLRSALQFSISYRNGFICPASVTPYTTTTYAEPRHPKFEGWILRGRWATEGLTLSWPKNDLKTSPAISPGHKTVSCEPKKM